MSTQTVIQREAPDIEALKIGLMEQAKSLTGTEPEGGLPNIQVAGADPLQTAASDLAATGIGAYQPFLTAGQSALSSGIGVLAAGQPLAQAYTTGQQVVPGFTAGTYDPTSVTNFMNPYQAQVTDAALEQLQNKLNAQAIQAGAFGGERSELFNRDALARAALEDYARNYEQAQQASMTAFENQQRRGQEAFEQQQRRQLETGRLVGALGTEGARTLGDLGIRQAGIGELATQLGQQDVDTLARQGLTNRQISQSILDAQRQSDLQQIYEPYQRLGFYSDILRGAPTTQQTLTASTSPQPSLLNQIVGTGIAGLGLYGQAKTAGIV